MPKLGVNIDHIATLREARRTEEPDPVGAAVLCELAGCDSIVVHLREDRRHIKERDLKILRQIIKTKLNLEMSVSEEIVKIALEIKPDQATLVPERREEITTEGGLDVVTHFKRIEAVVKRLKEKDMLVSLFIAPEEQQIKAQELLMEQVSYHTY